MRPTQLLARLPHSHIDPNWPPTVERESRTNFEFYKGQQTTFQRKRIGNGKSASQLRSQQATQVDGERHARMCREWIGGPFAAKVVTSGH